MERSSRNIASEPKGMFHLSIEPYNCELQKHQVLTIVVKLQMEIANTKGLSANGIINRTGFILSLVITILTIITIGIANSTPPLSGPFCQAGCFQYPYTDIASRFPRDYYYNTARPERRLFGQFSVAFAGISSAILYGLKI